MMAWTTARMRVTRSFVVSCLCMLNNTDCLSEHFACGISRALEKLLHIFTARPTKNCAGNSPLHPLFVCNGEADCANGIDEINCTQGMIIFTSL